MGQWWVLKMLLCLFLIEFWTTSGTSMTSPVLNSTKSTNSTQNLLSTPILSENTRTNDTNNTGSLVSIAEFEGINSNASSTVNNKQSPENVQAIMSSIKSDIRSIENTIIKDESIVSPNSTYKVKQSPTALEIGVRRSETPLIYPNILSFFDEETYSPDLIQTSDIFGNIDEMSDIYEDEMYDADDEKNDSVLTQQQLLEDQLNKTIDEAFFGKYLDRGKTKPSTKEHHKSSKHKILTLDSNEDVATEHEVKKNKKSDADDDKKEVNMLSLLEKSVKRKKQDAMKKTDDHRIKFHSVPVNGTTQGVCMDGTSPGYYLRKGWNGGRSKWIIHLHGGAWCYDLHSCSKRRNTILGSTSRSVKEDISNFFHGILSKDSKINPNFFNWNIAVLSYCDGGLFSGNRTKSLIGKGRYFYFQGRRILKLLIEDLQKKSLNSATDVVLSGTSAGGLAIALQGDYIRQLLPESTNVRGLIDAGIFLDQYSSLGSRMARRQFKALYSLHKPVLNKECLASFPKKDKFLCLFPENTIKYLKLPVFIVNALYDHWQLSELQGIHCVYKDKMCSTKQHDRILNFRNQMFNVLNKFNEAKNDTGIFANSCLAHGQAILDYTWTKVRISNKSIANSFKNWFEDDEIGNHPLKHFIADCKYPCNGSCPSVLAQRCVRNFKGASDVRRRRDAELC